MPQASHPLIFANRLLANAKEQLKDQINKDIAPQRNPQQQCASKLMIRKTQPWPALT